MTGRRLAPGFLNAFANADPASFPNISGKRVGDFRAGIGGTGLFTVDFAADLQQVAFSIISAPGTATFQAFLNGGLVETFTGSTSTTDLNNFYGFQGIVLDRLTISVQSFDNVFIMDNLQTIRRRRCRSLKAACWWLSGWRRWVWRGAASGSCQAPEWLKRWGCVGPSADVRTRLNRSCRRPRPRPVEQRRARPAG